VTDTTEKITGDRSAFGVLEVAPSLRERVYLALEESIVDGAFPPGYHLREDDLAKRLGVSRNPVREALQRLVPAGLVDHRPGKGIFVHVPGIQEVENVFHTRTLLESESARLAAERISLADITLLEQILGRGREAVEAKDATALLELNEQFHQIVIVAADNAVMAEMMISLQRRIRWYFSRVVVTRAVGSWEQHSAILEALRARDGEGAARLIADHVKQTGETIRASLSAAGS
jgi:DNA-binding GntR family transcriptional regulator